MSLDKNIDDELRRMLADLDTDERLDVAVRHGAEETIVAGARRLRRRRIAAVSAAGALTAAAVVVGGFVLAAGGPEALPPASSQHEAPPDSSTSSAGSMTRPPAASKKKPEPGTTRPGGQGGGTTGGGSTGGGGNQRPVPDPPPGVTGTQIGPTSYSALSLGMSFDAAKATGMVGAGFPPPADGCSSYPLVIDGQELGQLQVSATSGVQVLYPAVGLHTADGPSNGWTLAQVEKVYPEIDEAQVADSGLAFPAVRGNPGAVYRLEFVADELVGIALQASAQPCTG